MRELYRCLDCDLVFSVVDAPDADREVNAERDAHRGHRLRPLRPAVGRSWSRDSYDAPSRTVWAPVNDGGEDLLLVRQTSGPTLPCRYRLVRGSVVDLPPTLGLPEEDLLRQIVWARSQEHPTADEVAAFIEALRREVRRIDPDSLEEEYGDFHDPLLSHARLPAGLLDRVVDRCRVSLSASAAAWFKDFVRDHGDSLPAFEVRVRRDFKVLEEGAAAAIPRPAARSVA